MSLNDLGRNPLGYMGTPPATAAQAAAGVRDNVFITPETMLTTDASTTQEGVVRLATVAETTTGTADDIATTPLGVAAVAIAGAPDASTTTKGIIELSTDGEAVARVNSLIAVVPSNLTAVLASPPAIGGTVAAPVTCTNFTASGTFSLSGDDIQVTEGGTGLGTSALGDLLLGSAVNTYALLNIGATPRQLLQVNAGGTTAEWTSDVDIPGTLDVTGAALFDSTVEISGVMTFDDAVTISGTLLVSGHLTCNSSATILTAGTALGLGTDDDSAAVNIGVGAVARAIGIGNSAAGHTVTIGSISGSASVLVQSGTAGLSLVSTGIGDITATAGDSLLLTAAGLVTLNATSGTIGIGNAANAFGINIGTGAAARTITLGNVTGATDVVFNSGTGGFAFNPTGAGDITFNVTAGDFSVVGGGNSLNLGSDAADNTVTLGSTNTFSTTLIQAGTGDIQLTSLGSTALDSVGFVNIDSSAGAIGIGTDAVSGAINVGTGASARVITIGNITGASQVVLNSGTAGISLVGTGGGSITLSNDDTILIDSGAALELNASGGAISIGNDVVSQSLNLGTGGARTISIGNNTGATMLMITSGTGGIIMESTGTGDINIDSDDTLLLDSDGVLELNSSGGAISIGNDAVALSVNLGTGAAVMANIIGSTTSSSSTLIRAGTGGINLTSAGNVSMVPATATMAGTSLTLNARVGVATFTGNVTAMTGNIDLTITNSEVIQGQGVFCTVSNIGSNDADITLEGCITETAGTLLLRCQNNGSALLNGDIIVTFWLIN